MYQENKYGKKILGSVFMLLFAAYFAGINLFPHVHEENGVRIVHSHPYTKGGETQHGHTSSQLKLIENLSWFVAFAVVSALVLSLFRPLLRIVTAAICWREIRSVILYASLRGPPCC